MAKEEKEKDYTVYVSKEETPFQTRFADWMLTDEVGVDPASLKTKMEAFRLGVKLGTSLRIEFQQHPINKEARAEAKNSRAAAADEEKVSRKANKKSSKKASAPAEEEEAEEDEEEEEEAPRPAKKAAKKAAAKKATKKAKPRPADDEDDEADEF